MGGAGSTLFTFLTNQCPSVDEPLPIDFQLSLSCNTVTVYIQLSTSPVPQTPSSWTSIFMSVGGPDHYQHILPLWLSLSYIRKQIFFRILTCVLFWCILTALWNRTIVNKNLILPEILTFWFPVTASNLGFFYLRRCADCWNSKSFWTPIKCSWRPKNFCPSLTSTSNPSNYIPPWPWNIQIMSHYGLGNF